MSEFIRPQIKTILREPDHAVCKSEDKLRLLVVVYSSPQNYERRRIIRKTWGQAFAQFPGKLDIPRNSQCRQFAISLIRSAILSLSIIR